MIIKTQSILFLSPCARATDYVLWPILYSHSQLNNNHSGVRKRIGLFSLLRNIICPKCVFLNGNFHGRRFSPFLPEFIFYFNCENDSASYFGGHPHIRVPRQGDIDNLGDRGYLTWKKRLNSALQIKGEIFLRQGNYVPNSFFSLPTCSAGFRHQWFKSNCQLPWRILFILFISAFPLCLLMLQYIMPHSLCTQNT